MYICLWIKKRETPRPMLTHLLNILFYVPPANFGRRPLLGPTHKHRKRFMICKVRNPRHVNHSPRYTQSSQSGTDASSKSSPRRNGRYGREFCDIGRSGSAERNCKGAALYELMTIRSDEKWLDGLCGHCVPKCILLCRIFLSRCGPAVYMLGW